MARLGNCRIARLRPILGGALPSEQEARTYCLGGRHRSHSSGVASLNGSILGVVVRIGSSVVWRESLGAIGRSENRAPHFVERSRSHRFFAPGPTSPKHSLSVRRKPDSFEISVDSGSPRMPWIGGRIGKIVWVAVMILVAVVVVLPRLVLRELLPHRLPVRESLPTRA